MIFTIFILPVIILLAGYLMNKYPPKKVNWFIGYRTRTSMKDENSWEEANRYCGELWMKIGVIMIAISLVLMVVAYLNIVIFSEAILGVIVICQIIPLFLSGLMVEDRIKNKEN
ncbi:MAG: SdpI family protein [Clostridia bacterium]|nr:SdpI family protein [Clostridia bacterium]